MSGCDHRDINIPQHLHQMHRDIVFEVPEGCVNLGSSPRYSIQGLYKPDSLLSIQAHPEFNEHIMSNLLKVRKENGILSAELCSDGALRAGKPHDGELFLRRAIQFVTESMEKQ